MIPNLFIIAMPLLNSAVISILKKSIGNTQHFIKYPHETQLKVFNELIFSGKNTEWGKKHDYRSIKTIEDYRKRVPLSDYDAMKPYIDMIMKGKQNLLWNSPIKWFAKSSGTTSDRSKFIPVSAESLKSCHFKGGTDMLATYFHNNPGSGIFNGKTLAMGGSLFNNESFSGSFYGDISAIIMKNLPFWAGYFRSPGLDIALMDKWEDKIERMAVACMNQNITCITGVPSWMMLLLNRITDLKNAGTITDVWKNLELFIHGGVNFKPYIEQYSKLAPKPGINYLETYNSTEGFFGFQDSNDKKDLLLMLDNGIFYEFLPYHINEIGDNTTISLENVNTHDNYALVISTNSGLWRYIIGDTIRFTSLNPYHFIITGRTRNFINAFGEEVIIENAIKALTCACEKTSAIVTEFTAAPVYLEKGKTGAHEWLIEFKTEPDNLNNFILYLDEELKKQNSDYEAKRYHNMILQMPVVRILPEGTFLNWMGKKGKLGGQNKVPKLCNERIYIEDIKSMIQ